MIFLIINNERCLAMDKIMLPVLILLAVFAFYMAYKKFQSDKAEKDAIAQMQKDIERARYDKATAISNKLPLLNAQYEEKRKELSIPTGCSRIGVETTVFGLSYEAVAPAGSRSLLQRDFYFWNKDSTLYIFPTEDHLKAEHIDYTTHPEDIETIIDPNDIPVFIIPLSAIKYYNLAGTEKSETNIQTANTGVNVKGAIIGGLIAGDAGAIIGSQHNTHNVYSTTRHIDERCVDLYYTENGATRIIKLSTDALSLLEKWCPEKAYGFVVSQPKTAGSNAVDEIKKYKELLDAGIITQNEFDAKKKQLLNIL